MVVFENCCLFGKMEGKVTRLEVVSQIFSTLGIILSGTGVYQNCRITCVNVSVSRFPDALTLANNRYFIDLTAIFFHPFDLGW